MTSAQIQAAAALSLALLLHLGAFALRPAPAGASASGAGGSDLISLQPADASIADLVAAWQEPPQTSSIAPDQKPAIIDSALPMPPATEAVPEFPALPSTPTAPLAERPPAAVDAPPAPPKPPEPTVKPQPRPKPAPEKPRDTAPAQAESAPLPAQRAAGTGNGTATGQNSTSDASTLSQAQVNDALAGWGASIRARIEKRKRYPAAADGAEGSVTLRITISRTGQLQGASIAASSGNAALDAAALKAVQAAGRFAKAPSGLTEASYSFTLPMRFSR